MKSKLVVYFSKEEDKQKRLVSDILTTLYYNGIINGWEEVNDNE